MIANLIEEDRRTVFVFVFGFATVTAAAAAAASLETCCRSLTGSAAVKTKGRGRMRG